MTCENCNGWGEVMVGDPDIIGQPEYPIQCGKCEGSGFVRSSANDRPSTREEQAQVYDKIGKLKTLSGIVESEDTTLAAELHRPSTHREVQPKTALNIGAKDSGSSAPPTQNTLAATPSQPEPETQLTRNWPKGNKFNICYGCGNTFSGPGWKIKPLCAVCEPETKPSGNVGTAHAIPADAEESLSEWYDETERNQRENERQDEEREWARQLQLQEETDDR